MPWQNNGGGRPNNPWGNGGGRPGGGSGGGEPPQMDELIKKGQERLKAALPGGANGIGLILLIVLGIWLASGLYRVEANEEAVVLRFGEWTSLNGPGLHWHLPYPVETVEIQPVTKEKTTEVGSRSRIGRNGRQTVQAREESLMLTGDENIVDFKFNVVWRIGNLGNYLFKLSDPDGTVKSVSESVMREIIGKNEITPIITKARGQIQQEAEIGIQRTLDDYEAGVTILRVQIIEAEAPAEVKEAFLDVQRAAADKQRFINEADAYARRVVPEARGQAQSIIQVAKGYASEVVARATGEASRFSAVYNEYRQAKEVTRRRIYLETMEDILAGMDKVILDGSAGSGVVPYLPLDNLSKRGSDREENE